MIPIAKHGFGAVLLVLVCYMMYAMKEMNTSWLVLEQQELVTFPSSTTSSSSSTSSLRVEGRLDNTAILEVLRTSSKDEKEEERKNTVLDAEMNDDTQDSDKDDNGEVENDEDEEAIRVQQLQEHWNELIRPRPAGCNLVFVGDSVTRYQYLSLVYFLRHGHWWDTSSTSISTATDTSTAKQQHERRRRRRNLQQQQQHLRRTTKKGTETQQQQRKLRRQGRPEFDDETAASRERPTRQLSSSLPPPPQQQQRILSSSSSSSSFTTPNNLMHSHSYHHPAHPHHDWNEFFWQSNQLLYPLEMCDCDRRRTKSTRSNGILLERRYFHDAVRNNTVVYINLNGHETDQYPYYYGRLHARDIFSHFEPGFPFSLSFQTENRVPDSAAHDEAAAAAATTTTTTTSSGIASDQNQSSASLLPFRGTKPKNANLVNTLQGKITQLLKPNTNAQQQQQQAAAKDERRQRKKHGALNNVKRQTAMTSNESLAMSENAVPVKSSDSVNHDHHHYPKDMAWNATTWADVVRRHIAGLTFASSAPVYVIFNAGLHDHNFDKPQQQPPPQIDQNANHENKDNDNNTNNDESSNNKNNYNNDMDDALLLKAALQDTGLIGIWKTTTYKRDELWAVTAAQPEQQQQEKESSSDQDKADNADDDETDVSTVSDTDAKTSDSAVLQPAAAAPMRAADKRMCALLDYCFNVSWTYQLDPSLYLDTLHFQEPVYRVMNEELLQQLHLLPKRYKPLDKERVLIRPTT